MHHACLNDHLERVKYVLSSTEVQLRSCNLVRLHTMCDTVGYYPLCDSIKHYKSLPTSV